MTNILFFSTRWFVSCLPFRYAWLPQIPRYLDQVFSQIEVGREKSTIYDKYRKPNFPREIQAIKLDECNATKLPFGCFVRQSGQREHSPEGNLTDGTQVKLPEGLCSPRPVCHTKLPAGSSGCTGLVLFTSLYLPRAVWFPVRGFYTKQRSSPWGRDLYVVYFSIFWALNQAVLHKYTAQIQPSHLISVAAPFMLCYLKIKVFFVATTSNIRINLLVKELVN